MRASTREYIKKISKLEFPEEVKSVILFGSEVYGTPNMRSDIDLAIVLYTLPTIKLKCDVEEFLEIIQCPYILQLTFVTDIYEPMNFDVREDIFKRGVVIYERKV